MHPGPVPVTGPVNPGTTTENALDGTMPDMDLHAYDDQGNHVGMNYQTVPLMRADLSYIPSAALGCGDKEFFPLSGALLSDTFWLAMGNSQTPSAPGMAGYPVASALCHGRMYNVVKGCGAVTTVSDDGTVSANAAGQDNPNPSSGVSGAANAERIWQFFDSQ